jgi:hypothetical protein
MLRRLRSVAQLRHCTPVKLSRGGCSFQFGRASAPMPTEDEAGYRVRWTPDRAAGSLLALRVAEFTIRLNRLFESLTTLDAGRNFAGLRVRVRRLPIEGGRTSSIDQPLVHLLAVLALRNQPGGCGADLPFHPRKRNNSAHAVSHIALGGAR